MTLIVFTLVIAALNLFILYVNYNGNFKLFHKNLVLVLSFGLLHFFVTFIIDFIFPQFTYILISLPIGLLYGPLLLLLLKHKQGEPNIKNIKLHFIPFLFIIIVYLIIIFNSEVRYNYHNLYFGILQFLCSGHFALYLFLFRGSLIDELKRRSKLDWFKKVCWLILTVGFFIFQFVLAYYFIEFRNNLSFHKFSIVYLYFSFLISICILLLDNSARIRLYNINFFRKDQKKLIIGNINDVSFDTKKRINSHITHDDVSAHRVNIELFIKKLEFLEIDLNKESFCKKVNIPADSGSAILKECYGIGYSQFINKLRLGHAAKLLKNRDILYTIDDLALVCGFNSRASFYRNFAKEFSCSPHQFRLDYSGHS